MHPIWLIANILPLPPTAKPKLKVCSAEPEVSCVVRQVSRHTTKAQCISLAQARPFPFRSADRFQQGHFIFSKDITILRSNKVSLLSVGLAGENPDLPTAAVKALSMSLDLSNLQLHSKLKF